MIEVQEFGVYSFAEKKQQRSTSCWLLVNLGELNAVSATLPSGKQLLSLSESRPFALLLPAGSCFDFDYGSGREDWVVELPSGAICESDAQPNAYSAAQTDAQLVALSWPGMDAEVPGFIRLDSLQVERSRSHLTRMLEAFHSPENHARLSLHLSFYALLDSLLNPGMPLDEEDPAEALRKRIIADRGFVMHLSGLSSACGYSQDHIRRLFEARFGLSPKVFRTDYRMRLAQDLLGLRDLSIQEVALELGYGHPAHFSAAFKRHIGQGPKVWKAQHLDRSRTVN
jgi:AraC-like DNA-binding protein